MNEEASCFQMWSLKYEFRHKDCKYLPMTKKLGVKLLTYPINNYVKGKYIYITAIHMIDGEKQNVEKYIKHLTKISIKVEKISENTVLTLANKDKNKEYYTTLYRPIYFFPNPIIHDKNIEQGEIFSWERKNLENLLKVLSEGKETEYFRLLHLRNKKINNIFLMNTIEQITERQRKIFEFAHNNGYYSFPRRVNLNNIAEKFKIRKSTCHEILRRAETNILQKKFV
jgi:predicted DNA binding protein